MVAGIAELIIFGLIIDWIFRKIKLPGLTGLLLLGVAMGPYAFGLISKELQMVSEDLRLIALIVILLRAGFELSWDTLSKIGFRAILMGFIPCILEICIVTIAAHILLDFTFIESAILGSVLGAVSPAVVVPFMIRFIQEGRGSKKGIPTLVLAGASCDDALAIVLCSAFTGIYIGKSVNIYIQLFNVPFSIITGISIGLISGIIFYKLFDRFHPRDTKKVLILLTISVFLLNFENTINNIIPFSSLITIMTMGFIILEKREHMAHKISSKLSKIWIPAQILLFTMVGAQVNVYIALKAGLTGLIIILIGLLGRSIGVQLCLFKSDLNIKERLFTNISYLPKATVQAAIGAAPLIAMKTVGMNTQVGEIILATAVLSILVTAPVGAFLTEWAGNNLLQIDDKNINPSKLAALESTEQK